MGYLFYMVESSFSYKPITHIYGCAPFQWSRGTFSLKNAQKQWWMP